MFPPRPPPFCTSCLKQFPPHTVNHVVYCSECRIVEYCSIQCRERDCALHSDLCRSFVSVLADTHHHHRADQSGRVVEPAAEKMKKKSTVEAVRAWLLAERVDAGKKLAAARLLNVCNTRMASIQLLLSTFLSSTTCKTKSTLISSLKESSFQESANADGNATPQRRTAVPQPPITPSPSPSTFKPHRLHHHILVHLSMTQRSCASYSSSSFHLCGIEFKGTDAGEYDDHLMRQLSRSSSASACSSPSSSTIQIPVFFICNKIEGKSDEDNGEKEDEEDGNVIKVRMHLLAPGSSDFHSLVSLSPPAIIKYLLG